ncbi:MAG: NAD(P)-dependent dehydrogenase (short-subunit alcohol dehydrogenase family) [Candidatus Krumholzibacteriia bacterium]|jgi:NAD(P)-dependent dehydrogenase (short-subunit alcohol dehydrogenase family)
MPIDEFVDPPDSDEYEGFLASRTALVTGAAKRIGHVLAVALAAEGAHVIVHYHTSESEAKATVSEITNNGGTAHSISGDLTDASVAESLTAHAAEKCGNPIDILVNNASFFERTSALETSSQLWDSMQNINLRAPFLLAQGFAKQLPDKWKGDIINLNDARSLVCDPEHFAYAIAKIGLHGLTRTMAMSLAPRIKVNELSLGAVMAPSDVKYLKTKKSELPAGRFPQMVEVVNAMMFLLGTNGVTGQSIRIDGGQYPS